MRKALLFADAALPCAPVTRQDIVDVTIEAAPRSVSMRLWIHDSDLPALAAFANFLCDTNEPRGRVHRDIWRLRARRAAVRASHTGAQTLVPRKQSCSHLRLTPRLPAAKGNERAERLHYYICVLLNGGHARAANDGLENDHNTLKYKQNPFSIAPMMDWTDRHCRFFHRLLTRRTLLYTEMITTGAILHGNRSRLLRFDPSEHPLALQLGGSEPRALAACATIAADLGFDEVNLNVGCPSDRVHEGRFGACLMREPALVGDCVAAMKAAVKIPVTVKCRLGIDDQDTEIALDAIVRSVVAAGADAVIVHARKAWLAGLSPKENREIPPLDYDRVHRLKRAWPDVPIAINGGIASIAAARAQLEHVDGVMLGRAAYGEPWRLLSVDPEIFGVPARCETAIAAAEALIPYIECELAAGTRLHAITRHLHGLFHGVPGARAFRRALATEAVKASADIDTYRTALTLVAGTDVAARRPAA
jgi:tRNA-dihydrouridine synthase A